MDSGDIPQVLELAARYIRQANADEPPERAAAIVVSALRELQGFMRESFAGHCEVAQRLASRRGLEASVISCLGQVYERWDGHGLPRGLKGEEVDPAVLLVALAQDAVVWNRIGGPEAAVATISTPNCNGELTWRRRRRAIACASAGAPRRHPCGR